MNSYPMTSTTFIRGEIAALESMNIEIKRYAIRRWDQHLVDPVDIAESARTRYLLSGNIAELIYSLFFELCTNMTGLVRTVGPWLKQALYSNGNFVRHVAYLLEAIMLRRQTKRDGIRHLHVHFSTNSTAVAMLTKFLGGPSYSFTAHGPDEFLDRTSGSLYMKIEHSDFVVAISNFCKVQLACLSGMEFWNKIHIVRCGIELNDFTPDEKQYDGNQTLVCVGRLCVQKGQLLLPKAAAALRNEFPGLRIVLIGDGPIRRPLEDLIHKHGVNEIFDLRGWQPSAEVRQALRNSRALLLPSFAEGLPVVIMEAFALRRPVISTYIAGIPELVSSTCGWIVPSGSESDLVGAMREALTADLQQLQRLGLEGRRLVEEKHNVKTNARQLRELLQAVLRAPVPM
jgi:glycosyltransferase involved in cell wall biosynthesis